MMWNYYFLYWNDLQSFSAIKNEKFPSMVTNCLISDQLLITKDQALYSRFVNPKKNSTTADKKFNFRNSALDLVLPNKMSQTRRKKNKAIN